MDDVRVISRTKQEFLGETFYLCGDYFQHDGKRLHRAVWEHFYGRVPEGFHVHHKDGDKSNNQIRNLALLPAAEHLQKHARTEARRENGRRAIRMAIQKAPEWHASPEGRAWHSRRAAAYWERAPLNTYVCDMCGREYSSRAVRHKGSHYCGPNCRAKATRIRKKAATA